MTTASDIRLALQDKNLTITEACVIMKMSQQNFYKHLRADPLSEHFIREFKEKFGLTTKVDYINERIVKYEAMPLSDDDVVIMKVPLVSEGARAGYLRGFADAVFIERLPKIPWVVDKEYKGNYMAFEVVGDSMDDNSRNSYLPGDKLLCREVAPHLWKDSRLHIRDWDFVIVHKTEGIIVKQIVEHDLNKQVIRVHSRNAIYEDFEIKMQDVLKILNVVQVTRRRV